MKPHLNMKISEGRSPQNEGMGHIMRNDNKMSEAGKQTQPVLETKSVCGEVSWWGTKK